MSWQALAFEVEYMFEYILWIINHFAVKLGQIINKVMGNIFGELDPNSKPFFIYQNFKKSTKFLVLKAYIDTIKNSKIYKFIEFTKIYHFN